MQLDDDIIRAFGIGRIFKVICRTSINQASTTACAGKEEGNAPMYLNVHSIRAAGQCWPSQRVRLSQIRGASRDSWGR